MATKLLLLAGTKKGLFCFTSSDRKKWDRTGPFQTGREINHAIYDARTGRLHAASNDAWFGCEMVSSPDLGKTWEAAKANPAKASNPHKPEKPKPAKKAAKRAGKKSKRKKRR